MKLTANELVLQGDRRFLRRRIQKSTARTSSPCSPEFSVIILDISAGGLMIEVEAEDTALGNHFFIDLPNQGATKVEVVSRIGRYIACRIEGRIPERNIAALLDTRPETPDPAAPSREERVRAARAKIAELSPRELDVMRGLLAGLRNKSIAHALDISPRTVEFHRSKLMAKLGARALSPALRTAFLAGVQPLGEDSTATHAG